MEDRSKLVAPCGLDCGTCELYLCRNNNQLRTYLISTGIHEEMLPCDGCNNIEGNCPVITKQCKTYRCAKEKGVSFCFECNDFPCKKLLPASDRANVLPHNLKIYNLCMIKKTGINEFVKESRKIKETYFSGRMIIGEGPTLERE